MKIGRLSSLDSRLSVKRNLDGTKTVYRASPYSSTTKHIILEIKNKFIGSGRWLRDSLIKMDTQRQDIVSRVARNNLAIRHRRADGRVHRELADMVAGGGDTFIN